MTAPLTDSVRHRLAEAGCVADPSDVYAGDGARFYDDLVGPDRSEILEVLAIARRSGPEVLDLAAGTGRLTVPLLRSGARVTALDLSPDMLARLRDGVPPQSPCTFVVADMCVFDLERAFDLIVLGATSITLLGGADRRRLYGAVRRHLAPTGSLLLSIAGSGAVAQLRVSSDREIVVETARGRTAYLQSQQVEAGGATRIVNWMPFPLPASPGPVRVLTTRLQLLDAATVTAELRDAGFAPPATIPVRTNGAVPGEGMVLLHTRADDGGADVA